MAKMTFTADNVKKNPFSFPKLKGEKKGDKFRIALLDPEPEFGWTHNLQKPVIEDGKAKMETKTAYKTQKQYEANVMKWVASPLCDGDAGILEENGIDPENCLMCREAKDSDRVKPPTRRFALPVFVYNTKPGKTELQNPFGGSVLLWTFGDRVFEKLVDIGEDVEDIRGHDLLLTSDNPDFNGFEIIASVKKAEYLQDKERLALAKEIFKENQPEDVMIFVGKSKPAKFLEADLEDIRAAWRVANGSGKGEDATAEVGVTLEAGLDDLLNEDDAKPANSVKPKAKSKPGEGRAQTEWLATEDEAKDAVPESDDEDNSLAASVGADKEESDGEADDFDDLLKGL